jgi:ABC-type Zn uptake system ZnuABC Zn-binding protein ZnuA
VAIVQRSPALQLPAIIGVTMPFVEDFVRQIGKENVEVYSSSR